MGLAVGISRSRNHFIQVSPTAVKAAEGHCVALVSFQSGVPVLCELWAQLSVLWVPAREAADKWGAVAAAAKSLSCWLGKGKVIRELRWTAKHILHSEGSSTGIKRKTLPYRSFSNFCWSYSCCSSGLVFLHAVDCPHTASSNRIKRVSWKNLQRGGTIWRRMQRLGAMTAWKSRSNRPLIAKSTLRSSAVLNQTLMIMTG